ncbi:MAG: hypothetical protein JW725_04570 [Candidatus Babeliaceae bacterium]|nr:hypothetical protein [Candidatus Babeliaceae bacterium]
MRYADGSFVQTPEGQFVYVDRSLLEGIYNSVITNPYKDEHATVRPLSRGGMGECEIAFNKLREERCCRAISDFIGESVSLEETPSIDVLCSGGGVRASLWTLGGLKALEESKILPMTNRVASLSGSTWTVASWMISGKSFNEFYGDMMDRITNGFFQWGVDEQLEALHDMLPVITEAVIRTIIFEGTPLPSPAILIYGLMLGASYLGVEPKELLTTHLAQQGMYLTHGEHPLPLYTFIVPVMLRTEGSSETENCVVNAVNISEDEIANDRASKRGYLFGECSPFEVAYLDCVGSDGASVPTWSVGSSFVAGSAAKINPPLPLCTWMGIWGSAISASFREIYEHVLKTAEPRILFSALQQLVMTSFGDIRLFAYKMRNFTRKMNDVVDPKSSKHAVVDAGLACNIPIWTIRPERSSDLVIIFDASGNVADGGELQKAEVYAQQHAIPFPKIDYEKALSQPVSIFDDGPGKPVVVYIPIIKNERYNQQFDPLKYFDIGGFLHTFNFNYSLREASLMTGLVSWSVREVVPTLKKVVKLLVERKREMREVVV